MAVLNKRTMGKVEGAVYCGRGSKWGNPFVMKDHSAAERNRVCEAFEIHLFRSHKLLRALDELKGRDLICFCAPLRCHCDLLHRLANSDRQGRIDWFKSVREKGEGMSESGASHHIKMDKDDVARYAT